jgi:hypothetical protein
MERIFPAGCPAVAFINPLLSFGRESKKRANSLPFP